MTRKCSICALSVMAFLLFPGCGTHTSKTVDDIYIPPDKRAGEVTTKDKTPSAQEIIDSAKMPSENSIKFDAAKYGLNDITEEELLKVNDFRSQGYSDEDVADKLYQIRQRNGGRPMDWSKEWGRRDEVVPAGAALSEKDLYLGDIGIDDQEYTIKQKLGKVGLTEKIENDGIKLYSYDKYFDIRVKDGVIVGVASDSSHIKTPRGTPCSNAESDKISPTVEDIMNTYGQRECYKSEYNDLDLYEYDVMGRRGKWCILRFAFKKDTQRLQYISMQYK